MLNWELIAVPEDDRVAAWGGWPVNCPEPPPSRPPRHLLSASGARVVTGSAL